MTRSKTIFEAFHIPFYFYQRCLRVTPNWIRNCPTLLREANQKSPCFEKKPSAFYFTTGKRNPVATPGPGANCDSQDCATPNVRRFRVQNGHSKRSATLKPNQNDGTHRAPRTPTPIHLFRHSILYHSSLQTPHYELLGNSMRLLVQTE